MGLVSGQMDSWTMSNLLPLLFLGMECLCSVTLGSLSTCIIIKVVSLTTPPPVWTVWLHKWIVFAKTFVTCQSLSPSFATPCNISLTCTSFPFRTISSLPVPPLLASFVNVRYPVSPKTSSSTPPPYLSR
jgi:hypothetical protein